MKLQGAQRRENLRQAAQRFLKLRESHPVTLHNVATRLRAGMCRPDCQQCDQCCTDATLAELCELAAETPRPKPKAEP